MALRAANVERRLVTVVVRRADAATLVTRLALLKQPNMSRRRSRRMRHEEREEIEELAG
jgi:hypothetical protein